MSTSDRPMLSIPVSAAEKIGKRYGYDQVVIIARRVGDAPDPHGEHCTTWGRDQANCAVSAQIGTLLTNRVMGWVKDGTIVDQGLSTYEKTAQAARCGCGGHDDYCVCQNVPDRQTREERAIVAKLGR